MSVQRRCFVVTATIALAIGTIVPAYAARAATTGAQARATFETPAPPGRKGPDPKNWAKLDLPYAFQQGVIWVKIQPGTTIEALMKNHGLLGPARPLWAPPISSVARQIGLDRWFEVGVPRGVEKATVLRLSPEYAPAMLSDFVYVHLSWDFPGWAALTPNDPQFVNQASYLDAINIRSAWDKQVADSNIVVAVIDSGLRGSHQDSGVWKQKVGWDYVNSQDIYPGADTEWYFGRACFNGDGHGTQTASIAVADTNNGLGVAGTGFNAAVLPIRALGTTDGANCVWVVPQDRRGWAIRTAADRGAKVINMSYTFGTNSLPFESDSILYAFNSGALPISTAGNDGLNVKFYPCGYDYILCVGAAQWNGSAWTRWSGSNYGPWVDFSAPGVSIEGATANTTNSYKYGTATSYAAPLISGICALLHANGQTTSQSKFDKLVATSHPDGWTSFGFVDAGNALWH